MLQVNSFSEKAKETLVITRCCVYLSPNVKKNKWWLNQVCAFI